MTALSYAKDVRGELRKCARPTWRQTFRTSLLVLAAAAVATAFVGGWDAIAGLLSDVLY